MIIELGEFHPWMVLENRCIYPGVHFIKLIRHLWHSKHHFWHFKCYFKTWSECISWLYLFSNKLSNLQFQIEQVSIPPILLQVLAFSVKASNRAAELVRDVFQNKDLKIIQKTGEKDLQTKADRLANACIVGSLKKVFVTRPLCLVESHKLDAA